MPRYEPKRDALPLVKPGDTLKMRRGADGSFAPVAREAEPAAAAFDSLARIEQIATPDGFAAYRRDDSLPAAVLDALDAQVLAAGGEVLELPISLEGGIGDVIGGATWKPRGLFYLLPERPR